VLLIMLAVLALAVGYFGSWGGRAFVADMSFHPIAIPTATAPPSRIAAALAGATAAPSASAGASSTPPAPTAAGVSAALASLLRDPALGPSVSAQVYDAGTGQSLFASKASELVTPASTAKLLVAAAALTVHKPTDRFTTKVVRGTTPGSVVLVGGGDPTLSAAAPGKASEYPEAGRISDLAAAVRASLAGAPVTEVLVDDSLFVGPTTAQGWDPEDAPSGYASPITAAMVDGGRDAPGDTIRSAAPDLAAGRALATALGAATVDRGSAPAGARQLGSVASAPVSALVEQMLTDSDNVIAEVLARQVAVATGQPATFVGGAAAIRSTLAPLGIAVGTGMKDGSGLSALDRVPATALAQTLLAAVGDGHPQLRSILSGLSVAGWDGTLVEENRFTGAASAAVGVVRAKTGSLTGVSALAGVLVDADGRQLVYVFVADALTSQSLDDVPARDAIDRLAAALARCGCRR